MQFNLNWDAEFKLHSPGGGSGGEWCVYSSRPQVYCVVYVTGGECRQ